MELYSKCIEKLGEGDYGEVFRVACDQKEYALKVIPITVNNSAELIYKCASIFSQVLFALAAAEKNFEFEHRDLHIGNILISYSDSVKEKWEDEKRFMFNDKEIKINSYGLNVKIIDFTNSRITNLDGMPIFVDLAEAEGIFDGDALEEYQYEIPRMMRKYNG
uniref:Protein kinase domain-containing protein n=2 Tax=Meloidogyne TaxID=189290 RepID=A0A915NUM9_9BILA